METMQIISVYDFISPDSNYTETHGYPCFALPDTEAIRANAYYFGQQDWAQEYLDYCHRDTLFIDRWQYASGSWENKIVVDIGCGPGNLQASLQQKPALLIGVDVAPKSLELASHLGYAPVLADAHRLPFVSGFADLVLLNASLHHCENMEIILAEAARLLKPGGKLITDHDPQKSAWDYKGIAKLLWRARLKIYQLMGHSFHKEKEQQHWALKSEIHHKPGHGVSKKLFEHTLSKLGFHVQVYPHNHTMGKEIFTGSKGIPEFKYILATILSGRNPFADESALSLMCIAKKSIK